MNESVLTFELPGPSHGVAYLTPRAMGDMGIDESAREGLFHDLKSQGREVDWLRQIHSREVLVSDDEPVAGQKGDGIITDRPDRWIGVTVADCLPIYGVSADGRVRFIVHSGWKGTGILAEVLGTAAKRYGVEARDMSVLIGPGIGSCCYSVGDDRAELFRQRYGSKSVAVREGVAHLDLGYCNEVLAETAGVRHLARVDRCTSCDSSLGSFRREGPGAFTRMFAFL